MVYEKYRIFTEDYKCLVENKILGIRWDKFDDNLILILMKVVKDLTLVDDMYPPRVMLLKQ